ncbi:NADP-dependent oxidoreductase [Rhodococcoides yunnanense]|uniref:NADP-dependent oxidoreductase n=1 Tax=Rhodococcoides yunnanense TaxID=278209 RepID=UPI0009334747|nr:NADP-dependent oxidoreductase [Rhodococcus yunnanensis]
MHAKEIHLASRPTGEPVPDNFRTVTTELPPLEDGQILVRNIVMSVDPYMRGRMNDVKSYVPPFRLDTVLDGGAVGEVIETRNDAFSVGDAVSHGKGWRDIAIVDGKGARTVDLTQAQASSYLGALGMTGLTAYSGLTAVAQFKPGDTVFVSGAAGAVGSLVGQIARKLGAERVIGSAGSPAKVARLLELGFDAAFDYHDGSVKKQLAHAAPDGIDVYFDNVGGDHLEAAITSANKYGRFALCGAISQYNSTEPSSAPRNLALAIGKELTLKGFIVGSYGHLTEEFSEKMTQWIADGDVEWDETVVDGLENAPQAFIGLLRGENTGKMIVAI